MAGRLAPAAGVAATAMRNAALTTTIALALTGLLAGSARPGPVDYAVTYASIPGQVLYVQHDLVTGALPAPVPPAAQFTSPLRFGAAGARLSLPLPHPAGPFTASIETGLLLPLGDETFQFAAMTRSPAGALKNDAREGDFASWEISALPLLATFRFADARRALSWGGQAAAGAMLLGLRTRTAEAVFDNANAPVSRAAARSDEAWLTTAVEVSAGFVVRAAEGLAVHAGGGLLWLAPSRRTASWGTVMHGVEGLASPGLIVGGLGFSLRLGLSLGL